ncbi:hypothetical protein KL771_16985 [Hyphomicrobiaceae bacterium 22]|uniref:Uncharacterized protein n=2 Tax=Prosthecodimorpha staleyi TaxID=2840188 RepID=A0A947D514_9HYPH|nr:hypothetical protein [Prosthecodimorpha staleyi]
MIRMTTNRFNAAAATVLLAGALVTGPAFAQTQNRALMEIPADKARISGSIVIDYNSRSERSQSKEDVYEIGELAIADLMILRGTISRVPETNMNYSVKFDVVNPNNPGQVAREVAILRGDVPIDSNGRYNPEAGNLRIDIVKGNQATYKYSGAIQGRAVVRWWDVAKKLKSAAKEATKAYSRYVDGKVITIQVKNPDPLRFDRLGLASGPFSFLAETKVSGVLDYDYELGNWLTDQNGVTFTYAVGDKVIADKITGSIRFVSEPGEMTDAKGKKHKYTSYYDYSLRLNEQPVNKDSGFFGGDTTQADTDAFFSNADTTKPGIYGRVYYSDSDTGCKRVADDKGTFKCVGPTRSEVTYDLKGVGVNYQQLANWVKLEQLVIGPFTDE